MTYERIRDWVEIVIVGASFIGLIFFLTAPLEDIKKDCAKWTQTTSK